jgi:hypothetical protein
MWDKRLLERKEEEMTKQEEYKILQADYINRERVRYTALLNGACHESLGLHNLSAERINARLSQLDEMEAELKG